MKSEKELVSKIKKLGNKLNRTPTLREFCKEYKTNIPKIFKFNNLIEKAGLKANKKPFNKEEVERKFIEYLEKNKKFPPATSWRKMGLTDSKTIIKHYGSVNAFKSLFIEINHFLNFSEKEMIKFLQEKIDNKEIKSSTDLINNKNLPNLNIILKILKKKTWEEVLRKMDRIEIQKTFIKEDMKKEYINLSESLNKIYGASKADIEKHSKYSFSSYNFIFGGMEGLRKECGFENPYSKSKINYEDVRKIVLEIYKSNKLLTKMDFENILKEKEITRDITLKAFKVMNLKALNEKLKNML